MPNRPNSGCEFHAHKSRILTKVDLIEGLIYIDMGVFDDWNIFEPKVEIWTKYKKTLQMLSNALDENASLKQSLTDAQIDLTMPEDIVELENKIEAKLNGSQG